MSHRKFEAPRHGHLGFLPRKRCKARGARAKCRSFPIDKKSEKPHFTAFMGYKVGSTHIVRELNKPGSKAHKKEVCEPVTYIDCPPMVVVGLVGYCDTPFGLRSVNTVWCQHVDIQFVRRYYRHFYRSGKTKWKRHSEFYNHLVVKKNRRKKIENILKYSKVIRAICHTQINKISSKNKKAHIAEIQINGGSIRDKVAFCLSKFEKFLPVSEVFQKDHICDVVGITRGKGFKGVISRWGVKRLPRKTHKGLRKVACIGPWHPSKVQWTVARAGQKGYHKRTELNKKIFMVGKDLTTKEGKLAGTTEFDITEKSINPMGGFPNYGIIKNDFLMIKGSIVGPPRRVVTLRQSTNIGIQNTRAWKEVVQLKFIDTSSKRGKGHFQTHDEKKKFFGLLKKDKELKIQEDLEKERAKATQQ